MTLNKTSALVNTTNIASEVEGNPPSKWDATILRYWLQHVAKWAVPGERVADCLQFIIPTRDVVHIKKSRTTKRTSYANLAVCGSVWMCPVCAARITEVRRQEVVQAIAAWDGSLLLVTYTMRHTQDMPLVDVLKSLKEAYRGIKSGDYFARLQIEYRWRGSVRTLEVTFGWVNGWHVHIHELVFVGKPGKDDAENCLSNAQQSGLKHDLYRQWVNKLGAQGKTASVAYGIHIESADSAVADYLAKWGHEPLNVTWDVSREITKQPVKKAKGKEGRTPMQLLVDFGEGDFPAGRAWKEYALGFKKSHQIQWSRGFRDSLKLPPEESDRQLAESESDDLELFATLTRDEWTAVKRAMHRGHALVNAREMDTADFQVYIADIVDRFGDHK